MPTKKKTTKKVVEKASKKKAVKMFTATAKVLGKEFTGTGETIYEAIGNITPGGVAGMVILTVSSEDGSKDRVIPHVMAKRMFNTIGLTREVALKNASLMFDGV